MGMMHFFLGDVRILCIWLWTDDCTMKPVSCAPGALGALALLRRGFAVGGQC